MDFLLMDCATVYIVSRRIYLDVSNGAFPQIYSLARFSSMFESWWNTIH